MSSKIVLPMVLLVVVFFTSIPLYGWPMGGGDEKDPGTATTTEKQEGELHGLTDGVGTMTDENPSAAVARGDGSRLPQEQAVQQGVEQPLDFSKMTEMPLVDAKTMRQWVEAEVAGDSKTKKEILDTAMKTMISKSLPGAKINTADLRQKLQKDLELRTSQAGGKPKVVLPPADIIVLKPRIIWPPRSGVKYTTQTTVTSPSVIGGEEKDIPDVIPAIVEHDAQKVQGGVRQSAVLKMEDSSENVEAGGKAKMVASPADSIVSSSMITLPPVPGVRYTIRKLTRNISQMGGEELEFPSTETAGGAHDTGGITEKASSPTLLKRSASSGSETDYGELLENESPNALFYNDGLGLVITVEGNECASDSETMSARPSLGRRVSSRLIMSPLAVDEKKSIHSDSVPPLPEFGLYKIRRNYSGRGGDEQGVPITETAGGTHDTGGATEKAASPAPLESSASSQSEYGELVDEEFDGSGDVIVEVPPGLTRDGKSCSLRFAFLKDQRKPSQRNLEREASSRILARAASDRAAVGRTEIDEDRLSAAAKEELTLAEPVMATPLPAEPVAAPEPIARPLAERYKKLSPEQQGRLNDGKIVVTETKGEPYQSWGMTCRKPSTFTAYYILDADERHATVVYLNPARATKILPMCAEVEITKSSSTSATANYIFQVEADLPLLGKRTFQDVVSMKSDRTFIEGQEDKISFETTAPSDYVKTFKGSFAVVPHEDKVLAAYEVTAEFQGLAGKFINNDAMENVVYGILWNIINVIRL